MYHVLAVTGIALSIFVFATLVEELALTVLELAESGGIARIHCTRW